MLEVKAEFAVEIGENEMGLNVMLKEKMIFFRVMSSL